ncbi:MAG: M20/M25/M40 family metallo-hydrolase [Thiohalospira sp.]
MTRKITLTFLFLFVLFSVKSQDFELNQLPETFHTISSHDILDYAKILSSEEFKGRLSGSPEFLESAKWVASKFKEWDVNPKGDNDTYFQFFDNPYTEVYSSGSVMYYLNDENEKKVVKDYRFPEEYFPGQNSGSGTIESDLVYVGYGITAPELGYDDYTGVDVKGKIIVMESGLPVGSNNPDIEKWVPYDYHQYKFKNAIDHGAIGWLYINKLANPNTSYHEEIVYAHIGEEVANDIFKASGKDYKQIKENINKNLKPNSFELKGKAKITAQTKRFEDSKAANVIGFIEGSDTELKEEVIIVGAHLDGVGSPGKLLPGALDNASGVVNIMAAAKALAQSEIKPKRSVMFILFGGEECGLVGSTYYVNHPKVKKENVICMINLDMVGNGTGLALWGGASFQEISKHFLDANDQYIHRSMRTSEARPVTTRPRSDGAVFTMNGYKSFAVGTTNRVKPLYYHHPLDNLDGLTPEIMEDAAKLLYLGLLGVANDEDLQSSQ